MSNQYPHGYPPQQPFPGQAPTQPAPGQYMGGMYPQQPFPGQAPIQPHGLGNTGRPVMNTNYATALNVLKILTISGVIAYFVLSNFYDVGDIKLTWQSIASAVGTISMLICAVIIVVTAHRMNRAKRAGDRTNMRKPIVSLHPRPRRRDDVDHWFRAVGCGHDRRNTDRHRQVVQLQ